MKKIEKYNKADLKNTGLMALASLKETGGENIENDTVTNLETEVKEVKVKPVDNAAGEVKPVDNAAGEVKPKIKKEKTLSELLDEKFGIINDGLQKSVEKSFNTFNSKVGQIAKDVNDLANTVNGIKAEIADVKNNSVSKSELDAAVKSAIADAKVDDVKADAKVDEVKADAKQTIEELAEELAEELGKDAAKKEEKSSGISCGVKVGIATTVGVAIGYAIKAILSSGE